MRPAAVVDLAFGLAEHADEHRTKRPVLLTVDEVLGG
jgi:hypothetical protein